MVIGGWGYGAVFVLTLSLTMVLTPLALRVARRRGMLDHPNEIKSQASPIPYLGGAAILLAFVGAVLVAALIKRPTSGIGELAVILGLACALGLVGLIDDLRGLSPWLRIVVEIGCGLVVWATPAGAQLFANDALDLIVTVGWILGITNAMNLLDNMDGLSAGVAAITATFVFVLAVDNGQFLVATLAISIAGCALGFLRTNFHPARIYMGDAGSLFLGFMLAVLALKLRFLDAPRLVGLGVPLLLLGVPIFDTALVTIARLRHGRSPLSGGRDHTSHRLVFVGIPVPVTVTLIYAACASLGVLALVLSRLQQGTALILMAWLVLLAAVAGVLLAAVPVYETSRRRHLMIQEVRRHEEPVPVPPRRVGGRAAFLRFGRGT